MWYRIELNKDQSVRSCEEVSCSLSGSGRTIHYVEADSKEMAIAVLVSTHLRRVKRSRDRHLDRVARGLCTCCEAPRVTNRFCRAHADAENARQRAVRNGTVKAKPIGRNNLRSEVEIAVLESARRLRDSQMKNERLARSGLRSKHQFERLVHEAKMLSAVLSAYDSDPASFRAWLMREIETRDLQVGPSARKGKAA